MREERHERAREDFQGVTGPLSLVSTTYRRPGIVVEGRRKKSNGVTTPTKLSTSYTSGGRTTLLTVPRKVGTTGGGGRDTCVCPCLVDAMSRGSFE